MLSFFDAFLILFVGLAAGFDLRERRIPNWLILFALTAGVLLNFWKGLPQLSESVLGFLLGMGIFIVPFVLGWVGAGDVKFVGAVGAVLGVSLIPRVIFYSALLGGVLALTAVMLRGANLQAFHSTWRDVKLLVMSRGAILPETISEKSRQGVHTIPFGVAIAVGTLVTFYVDPQGEWARF